MRRIGQELHLNTDAFAIKTADGKTPRILDMCMAPGGFLETALSNHPNSTAVAFTLPVLDGGHRVMLPKLLKGRVQMRYADITMFANDMGVESVPADHPDARNFLPRQLEPHHLFDLIICDGQVLRTQNRQAYRESREATRLSTTQLVIGLEHLRTGGTMIVLLHRLDAYETAKLIYTFHKFSKVRLFKPQMGHVKRSSFYMVASCVQSQDSTAKDAIEQWKQKWKIVTFKAEEDYVKLLRDDVEGVDMLLGTFGKQLAQLGKNVWQTQAGALAKSSFIRNFRCESITAD